jgi:hypothetical protein
MRADDERERVRAVCAVTEDDVRRALDRLKTDLAGLDREALKDALQRWISGIELDPSTRGGRIHYRLTISGVKLASPRWFVSDITRLAKWVQTWALD